MPTEDILAQLHRKLAQRLLELVMESDNPKVFDAAIRFLKDNGVNEDLAQKLLSADKADVSDLLQRLPDFEDEDDDTRRASAG